MEQVSFWVQGNTDTIVLSLGFGLLLSVMALPFIFFRPKKIQTGEGIMVTRAEWEKSHRTKRMQERQHVIDMYEDGLLELYASGKIDNASYHNWHDRFVYFLRQEEFIKRRFKSVAEIKELHKKRRNSGSYYGYYKTVSIPGPKPGEKVEVKQVAKDELHAVLLNFKLNP